MWFLKKIIRRIFSGIATGTSKQTIFVSSFTLLGMDSYIPCVLSMSSYVSTNTVDFDFSPTEISKGSFKISPFVNEYKQVKDGGTPVFLSNTSFEIPISTTTEYISNCEVGFGIFASTVGFHWIEFDVYVNGVYQYRTRRESEYGGFIQANICGFPIRGHSSFEVSISIIGGTGYGFDVSRYYTINRCDRAGVNSRKLCYNIIET